MLLTDERIYQLTMDKKYIYLFSEGKGSMKELLGGKGANLAEMTLLGMPVPQGFTITTEACNKYYEDGEQISPELEAEVYRYMEKLEEITGKKFGDPKNPFSSLCAAAPAPPCPV
jgi:pyruvate,orthophosphate dikinase